MNYAEEEEQENFNELENAQQQVSFHRIEDLEQFGIAKADISKLKHGGYHTIEAVRPQSSSLEKFFIVIFSNAPLRLLMLRRESWLKWKE